MQKFFKRFCGIVIKLWTSTNNTTTTIKILNLKIKIFMKNKD